MLECELRNKDQLEALGFITDIGIGIGNAYTQAAQVTGGEPWTTIGGTVLLAIPEIYNSATNGPNLTGQIGGQDIGELLGSLVYDESISKIVGRIETIQNTSMAYALDLQHLGVRNMFADELTEMTNFLYNKTLSVEGIEFDGQKAMDYAIAFIERVITGTFDSNLVEDNLKQVEELAELQRKRLEGD